MIITCGECDSSFILDDSLVKPSGSKVRCSNCKHVFVAYPVKPETLKEAPAASSYDFEDDPDLTKAVAAIDEKDLEFTDDELGVTPETPRVDIAAKAAAMPEAKTETPPVVIPEPVVETVAEPAVVEAALSETPAGEEGEDILDFADFEVDLEEDSAPIKDASEREEELSLDLEGDDMGSDFGDVAEEELDLQLDSGEEEELDFSDLELELDGDTKDTEVIGVSMTQDETDAADTMVVEDLQLDFSDEDLGIKDQATPPPLPEEEFGIEEKVRIEEMPEEAALVDDELDFSDLERELDGVLDEPAAIDELDLGLDEGEPETVLMDEDELDFSEFELEADDKGAAKGQKETPVDDEELDFSSLSKILDSEPEEEAERPSEDEDLELELDLDLEGEAETVTSSLTTDDDEEELDFSDLEDLLDDLEKADSETKSGAVEDLDLELDASIDQGGKDSDELVMEGHEEDLDFSDVEAMLDLDDDAESGELELEGEDDSDLELELEMEGAGDGKYTRIGDEEDPDIELELDLGDEDDQDRAVLELDEEDEDDVAMAGTMAVDQAAQVKEKAAVKKKAPAKPRRVAPGRGKNYVTYVVYALIVLVVLFLLYMSKNAIGRAIGADIPVNIAPLEQLRESISAMGIPGLSSFVAPEAKDVQGKAKLKTSGNITGKIIPGTKLGDLFVINGSVKNNYPETRNSISLVCKLFGKGGSVNQTKLFYAGNVIPEPELVNMAENMIMKRIQNRLGDNGINADVKPGQTIPFMVVFTRLGDNLTEFSVEPAGSMPGAAK
mgnify:CR=1 FL=1